MIIFIQERRPRDTGDHEERTIENSNAGQWHNHLRDSRNNAVIVLDDDGGTEFIEGTLEVQNKANVTHEEVEAALQSRTAQKKILKAGHVGHFNNETLHKRAKFTSNELRVAMVIQFEN